MKVALKQFGETLVGSTSARAHRAVVLSQVGASGGLLELDFAGVEAATSSYLRALIFGFMTDESPVPASEPDIFPVVSGMSEAIREELVEIVGLTGRHVVEAREVRGNEIASARLHGRLDEKLRQTLDALIHRGAATAADLHSAGLDSVNTPTAWNNRLAELHAKRLASRKRVGKAWVYQPISKELQYG